MYVILNILCDLILCSILDVLPIPAESKLCEQINHLFTIQLLEGVPTKTKLLVFYVLERSVFNGWLF